MHRRPKALKGPLDHNPHLSGEGLGLLHRMRAKNNRTLLPLRGDPGDDPPHEPPGLGVHSGAGLVHEDDRRVPQQSHCDRQFPLVAPREVSCFYVRVAVQVHFCYYLHY